jgi:hypothetical protein
MLAVRNALSFNCLYVGFLFRVFLLYGVFCVVLWIECGLAHAQSLSNRLRIIKSWYATFVLVNDEQTHVKSRVKWGTHGRTKRLNVLLGFSLDKILCPLSLNKICSRCVLCVQVRRREDDYIVKRGLLVVGGGGEERDSQISGWSAHKSETRQLEQDIFLGNDLVVSSNL